MATGLLLALPLRRNAGIPVLSPNDLRHALPFPFSDGGGPPADGSLSSPNGRFGGCDGGGSSSGSFFTYLAPARRN